MSNHRVNVARLARITGGFLLVVSITLAVLAEMVAITEPAKAASDPQVEILTGRIELGEIMVYTLPDLIEEDTLYVHVTTLSGNLDPFIGIAEADVNADALIDDFSTQVEQAIKKGRDPTEVIPEFCDQVFLAWDDDTGTGYDAATQWAIEPGGEYRLLLFASNPSFGEYRLTVGINDPEVLTGEAESTGQTIALLDRVASHIDRAVEETSVELTADKISTFISFRDFAPGDTLYVFVEAVSGDMRPVLELMDYSDKLLRMGNASGKSKVAKLQHEFTEASRYNSLVIYGWTSSENPSSSEFRVLIGINAPDVLEGTASTMG